MASNNIYHRLEEYARWFDWNRDTVSDVKKRQEFQEKCMENFFDLFALMVVKLRDLEGQLPNRTDRPNFLPLHMPNFVSRPDDEI